MEIERDNSPVLEYAGRDADAHLRQRSNWPVGIYVGGIIWAWLTMGFYAASMGSYSELSGGSPRTQLALLLCAAFRLIYARVRRERNKGWIFYIAILYAAGPIWAVIAPPLYWFGLNIWGRGRPLLP